MEQTNEMQSGVRTPYYVIHKKVLDENFKKLTDALDKHWNNYIIGYSYKTNALPWIIKHFVLWGAMLRRYRKMSTTWQNS